MTLSKYILLLLCVLIISSCAEYHFKSDVPEQYEIIRLDADVTPGLTKRGEMQKKIGLPYVSNKEWNVEVYRVLTGQDVLLMGPIIPASIDVEDVRRQTIWYQSTLFLRDTFLPVASPV